MAELNAQKQKITLLAERLFIIRSVTDTRISFYEARRVWNASPMEATIFQNRRAAEDALYDLQHAENAILLVDEEFDIIGLYEAILTYGKGFTVRRQGK